LKGPHIANIVEIEEEGEGDDLAMGLGLGALFITFALYNWIGVHGLLDAAWARETAGSEWLLMLWFGPMVIPWGMAVGSVAVSAKKHTFITERDGSVLSSPCVPFGRHCGPTVFPTHGASCHCGVDGGCCTSWCSLP